MIIVYTGEGKGKTSACIGQAIRACGHGIGVAFAQFIKRDDVAGEQKILVQLLGDNFRAGGLGFVSNPAERARHQQSAMALLQWAKQANAAMTILDEVLYACQYRLLDWQELDFFADCAGSRERHLVLSGRLPQDWNLADGQTLLARADIITVMQPVRHPYALGIPACEGIEF